MANKKPTKKTEFFEMAATQMKPLKSDFITLDQAFSQTFNRATKNLRHFAQTVRKGANLSAQQLTDWSSSLRPVIKPVLSTTIGVARAGTTDVLSGAAWTLKHTFGRRAVRTYIKLFFLGVVVVGAVMAAIGTQTLATYAGDLSNPATIINNKNTGTTILDRNGQVLYKVYGAANRVPLVLSQTNSTLKDATLAAEDPNFYSHPGFSWKSTARAVYVDAMNRGSVEGGSTISQQLIKSSLLTPQKSIMRKYREILLSVALERRYSKDKVLEMYLNQIYYGQGANGAATAAQVYFHKDVNHLSIGEAAMIAGLPLGPSRFDPTFDHQAALERRDYVIGQMADHAMISPAQAAAAKAEPLVAYQQNTQINAPHFVFYVLDQLRQQYGDDAVENGGITVYTTLDLKKEQLAESIAQAQINKLAANHVTNAALISIDPKTGEILTMMGSVDYDQPNWGNVNATLSDLQPGSSFKPIAYVTAFAKGWNGATTVEDKPLNLPNGDGTFYKPVNYDGKFRGTVTLRRALANSLNIPAVQVLQYAGLDNTLSMAHALGITTLNDRSRYGLSLVLGGGEVRPLDMATVYGTFAASGVKHEPKSIIKVLDRQGKDMTKKPTEPANPQVLDPRLAYMITNILSDNPARSEEFGPNSPLKLNRPAAAKTGTTNDFRDNWTVGYTPSLVTAVWVGNNDHSAMNGINGITGAAPIWHDYMEQALAGTTPENFVQPVGIVTAKVCAHDGGLANPWDSGYQEIFLTEHQQTKHCASEAPKPPDQPQPVDQVPANQGQGNGNDGALPPGQPNPNKHGQPLTQN
ncbi:MAG TPA: PBP1A family penicillin-binding protein [Candidatus Saccharimonadales bacterium]|nr:PBP1A family penicillin-binding protein [Candidatus Saccharimonadales bacterium]